MSVIYTRDGDEGQSSTLAGDRLDKDSPVFEAGGTLDELSAHVALARVLLRDTREHDLDALLRQVQEDFVHLGAYISSQQPEHLANLRHDPERFESIIDQVTACIELEQFIIPGESELDARLHVARTVCRRMERRVVELSHRLPDRRAAVYLNRLSDLLFSLALWSRAPFVLNLEGG